MKFILMNTNYSRGDVIADKYPFVKEFNYDHVNTGVKARQYNFKTKEWYERDVVIEYIDINTDTDLQRFMDCLSSGGHNPEVVISMAGKEPVIEIYDGYRE